MNLQDGKQIEKLLVGEVAEGVDDSKLIRSGLKNLFRGIDERTINQRAQLISRMASNDPMRGEVFRAAVRPMRRKIDRNFNAAYSDVRKNQPTETEAQAPSRIFASTLLDDLEEALDDVIYADYGEGDQLYELRLFTAIGSELDIAKSVDFWVELRNTDTDQIVGLYNVDIKTNPNDHHPRGFANTTYYFDYDRYNNDEREDKIDPSAFEDDDYKNLVKRAASKLREQLAH